MKKFEEKSIRSESIYEGKVVSLKIDDVILPNGKEAKREIINHPGAVAIIAISDEGKLVLVEQYRKALERSIIEIPAGKLEKGEAPEQTARRELEEETGYGCQNLTYVQSFATSPGFADEIIHIFVATDLYQIEEKAALDEDEFVSLMEVTVEEAEKMVKDQRIFDAKTAFAVLWMKLNKA
ncbi:ADP-ribose pyrophosphatase [Ureibacillus massiliensis 4400831 = CIP 108448 = CCUG 49529]|uniref:ADP-ribose pyrophosphatase n=1 Tax=Ureibacillus massiliensis 4400831 = CIP 108448 = CCUG 49529 TaxID=1211035 RepID=A0A0A3J063_9BACL|nr:NUDIX hydrolase [Ureibacillus massiliensis]KGR90404.1 ADP-ribose pyrophosphatase [Ureibacillus massiliensis 4400831 = CIP 108448 = CCUG 49529]